MKVDKGLDETSLEKTFFGSTINTASLLSPLAITKSVEGLLINGSLELKIFSSYLLTEKHKDKDLREFKLNSIFF